MRVRRDVQNIASLGRVIVSNSAFQSKTSSPFDWFGHLLDSIHPITSLAAALVWSKVDPVLKHAKNVLPSLKLTTTWPKSMVGWMMFLGQEKAYFNRGDLAVTSLAPSRLERASDWWRKNLAKYRSTEMRWSCTGQASTLGSRKKKKNIHKKSCRNWCDPTFYYVLKSYQKELIRPSSCSNKNSSTKTAFHILMAQKY